MTGCPAWYDLEKVHDTVLSDNNWNLNNIYISDPADPKYHGLALQLVEKLHNMFGNANITFVFHRKDSSEKETELIRKFEQFSFVRIERLTHGAESFQIYKNCDLHIGFRVHAHIYNLSQRKKTVLIEEDGRGAGVNEALGIPSLLAYNDEIQMTYSNKSIIQKINGRMIRFISKDSKECFENRLEDYLGMMRQSQGLYYENAFRLMKSYYNDMEKYINDLKNQTTK